MIDKAHYSSVLSHNQAEYRVTTHQSVLMGNEGGTAQKGNYIELERWSLGLLHQLILTTL